MYRKPMGNKSSKRVFTAGGLNIDPVNYRPIPRGGLRL